MKLYHDFMHIVSCMYHPTFRFVAINFRTSISYGTTWQRLMVDRRPFLAGEWILAKSWLCENQIAIFTYRNILNLIFYDFLCPSFNWLFKHAGLVISISTLVSSWKYTPASQVSLRIIAKRMEKLLERQQRVYLRIAAMGDVPEIGQGCCGAIVCTRPLQQEETRL